MMCPETFITWIDKIYDYKIRKWILEERPPKRVVCPHCKRRLKPKVVNENQWHIDGGVKILVPVHKPKKWWKKKNDNL